MRRGYTLIELLVTMAVLAGLSTATLRLTFTGDRALQTQAENAAATTAALRLLTAVAGDLRADASAAYPPLPEGRGVRRLCSGEVEDFPGLALSITGGGRLRTITVSGRGRRLTTTVYRRRGD